MRVASILLSIVCFTFFSFVPPTFAGNSPASKILEERIEVILNLIKKPEYANPQTRPQVRDTIEREVRNIFAFDEFSSRTVGPRWSKFTAEEKQAFSDAFADLLLHTYLDKINGYNGEKYAYTGEVANTKGDRIEVQTNVTLQDGKVVPVFYRMLPKNNSWFVYDVVIEGMSLVKNYRTQFQNILAKSSPQELIAKVREKNKSLMSTSDAR